MEKTCEHRGVMKMRMRHSQNSEQNPSANSNFNKLLNDEQSPHPSKNLSLVELTEDKASLRTDIFARLPLWPLLSSKSKVAFFSLKKKGAGGNNIYKHYQFIPNLVFGLSVTPALMN